MEQPGTAAQRYYGSMSAEALLSLGSMEGIYDLPAVETRAIPFQPGERRIPAWPGYALAAFVAAVSYAIHYLPVPPFRIASEYGARRPVSASIIAIVAGLLVRNLFAVTPASVDGCKKLVRKILPITIVLTGAGLNLASIASVGFTALTITLICIGLAVISAWYFGRMLGIHSKTALLIGTGTAICGTSAIVAVAPLIEAGDEDLTLSIGTVNLLGLILMFTLPLLGGLLRLRDEAFAVWAGTSIHAVPQVVAAAFAFSQKSGMLATLVKLVRVALLAPFTFVLALWYARRPAFASAANATPKVHYARLVPAFLWGFLALSLLNTLDMLPALQFHPAPFLPGVQRNFSVSSPNLLVEIGNMLLTLAMGAMGLEVNLRFLTKVGGRAILTGVGSCLALCGASLALIRLLM